VTKPRKGPRVLFLDIETAPILGYVWSLWDQNVGLNQIHSDWFVLSWSAKWLGESKVMYQDQRKAKNIEDDSKLLAGMWKLLDAADIIVTQNGKAFDQKRLNARFIIQGFAPPSPFKHIDTKLIASKHFGFTSNKLEYMAERLCTQKKLRHHKFEGFELWRECLRGNQAAWREMEKYNRQDVLVLEELYHRLVPWDDTVNFALYTDEPEHVCRCGSKEFERRGWHYTSTGKFQRYRCRKCGAWTRDRVNRFSKEKKASLHISTPR
jgi:uncharacterized protein YprB with RNaseH-like and TPR domain